MNDKLDKINAGASFIEVFMVQHPIVFAWICATVASWVLTAACKLWLEKGPTRARKLRTIDVVIAIALSALGMFGHVEWKILILVSLAIGGSSPFIYFGLSEALCAWKPGLRKYLSLREFTPEPEPDPDTGDETRSPANDTTSPTTQKDEGP